MKYCYLASSSWSGWSHSASHMGTLVMGLRPKICFVITRDLISLFYLIVTSSLCGFQFNYRLNSCMSPLVPACHRSVYQGLFKVKSSLMKFMPSCDYATGYTKPNTTNHAWFVSSLINLTFSIQLVFTRNWCTVTTFPLTMPWDVASLGLKHLGLELS